MNAIDFTRKEEKKPELQKNDSVRTQEVNIYLKRKGNSFLDSY